MKTEQEINIYTLMTKEGKISSETLQLIRSKLNNQLAQDNIGKALKLGRDVLTKANIYGLCFGNVTMWLVRAWDRSAMDARLNIPFVNQDIHDLDTYQKAQTLTE